MTTSTWVNRLRSVAHTSVRIIEGHVSPERHHLVFPMFLSRNGDKFVTLVENATFHLSAFILQEINLFLCLSDLGINLKCDKGIFSVIYFILSVN